MTVRNGKTVAEMDRRRGGARFGGIRMEHTRIERDVLGEVELPEGDDVRHQYGQGPGKISL